MHGNLGMETPDQNLERGLITQVLLFHQGLRACFGLRDTEHRCLDILYQKGPMTAGRLADVAGLTTGAITKIVDRLVKAGFVNREHSQVDRRQVIINLDTERAEEISAVYTSLVNELAQITARMSLAEQALVQAYQAEFINTLREKTARLQENSRT